MIKYPQVGGFVYRANLSA